MEEHFWAQKSLVADIDLDGLGSVRRLVLILLELIAEIPLSICCLFLLVEFLVFLHNIFADVSILLLNCLSDL
jgi:hypothetical protein